MQLSSSANFAFDKKALERPDFAAPVRTINMIRLGEALTTPDAGVGGPPVRALIVYNSNPAAVAPDRNAVLRGMAREDLFTVVLEHFQTDTADYADIVLPATTQLEHWDLHAVVRPPLRLAQSARRSSRSASRCRTARSSAGSRRAWASTIPSFADDDLTMIRQALASTHEKIAGVTLETLLEKGWTRLNVPTPYLPYADGGFSTPSGKCELVLAAHGRDGPRSRARLHAAVRVPRAWYPRSPSRYPLTLISSPAHQFLNSTFVNVDALRRGAREPECLLHPADAERRGIGVGMRVVVHNDRGAFTAVARVEDSIREGVVWAPSIWWGKFAADGANANQTTSQRETDLGHGPVFYDNLVEVGLAD